jgi:hypothetical protein
MSKSVLLQGDPGSILIHEEKDKMIRTPDKAKGEAKGKEVLLPVADSQEYGSCPKRALQLRSARFTVCAG